jgi:hypothetical protein
MLQMTGRVTVSSHGADRMKCGTIEEFNLKRGRASPIHFEHHVARVLGAAVRRFRRSTGWPTVEDPRF